MVQKVQQIGSKRATVSKQQIKLSKPEVLDEYNDFEVDHFARKEEKMRGSRSVKDLKAKVQASRQEMKRVSSEKNRVKVEKRQEEEVMKYCKEQTFCKGDLFASQLERLAMIKVLKRKGILVGQAKFHEMEGEKLFFYKNLLLQQRREETLFTLLI